MLRWAIKYSTGEIYTMLHWYKYPAFNLEFTSGLYCQILILGRTFSEPSTFKSLEPG